MKQVSFLFLLLWSTATQAQPLQELSLGQCYELSRQQYPLIRQQELIQKTNAYTLENISKGYLPQLQVNGQATYQSEVTQIPIQVPGMDIPTLSKDQYKIYAELSQQLYDGGSIRSQKELQQSNGQLAQQQLEVELYKVRDRVSQLFFGILVAREQAAQNLLLQKDLEISISKAKAGLKNGTLLQSNVDILEAELLNTQQRQTELLSVQESTTRMLALFLGKEISRECRFIRPEPAPYDRLLQENKRPELALYESQYKSLAAQQALISARNRPRIGFFVQGGYGRPALNMLNNDFSAYYIGGLRVSWSLSGLYTTRNDRSLISLNQNSVNVQKETFLFNTRLTAEQQYGDIKKTAQLLQTDDEIIRLRTKVQQVSAIQLEQGTITSGDYIRDLNAADKARQNKILHEIQLLMAQQQLQWTTNQQ